MLLQNGTQEVEILNDPAIFVLVALIFWIAYERFLERVINPILIDCIMVGIWGRYKDWRGGNKLEDHGWSRTSVTLNELSYTYVEFHNNIDDFEEKVEENLGKFEKETKSSSLDSWLGYWKKESENLNKSNIELRKKFKINTRFKKRI